MNNQTINELHNRKLDNCLISIIVIPTKFYYKEREGLVNEKEIYFFFSCNIYGKRKFITSALKDKYNKTSDWYDLLLSFKDKGINVILFGLIPNNQCLSKALKLAFNEINIFISCFETIDKLSKYYTESYSNGLFNDVKNIYLSKDLNTYYLSVNDFKEKYCGYTFIYDLFQEDLKRAKKYYEVDYEIRNFVFSFYFCRDIKKKLNIISNSKNYFSSTDEIVNELIPVIQRFETRIFCPKNTLKNIINKLYSDKKDLIKSYL